MTDNDSWLMKVVTFIQEMFGDLRNQTLRMMNEPFTVETKTSDNDLVTTVDRQKERFIRQQLSMIDPQP